MEVPPQWLHALDDGENALQGARMQQLLDNYTALLKDSETVHLRRLNDSACDVRNNLDGMLSELANATTFVMAQRHRADTLVFNSSWLLHPMRSLPIEVLQLIFTFAIPTSEEIVRSSHDSLSCHHTPFVLSYVCRKWRHAALKCQAIWATIALNLHNKPATELLELVIQRSNWAPLDVCLYNRHRFAMRYHDSIVSTLRPSCPRWRTFTVDVSDAVLRGILQNHLWECRFDNLEVLRLVPPKPVRLWYGGAPSEDLAIVTMFASAQHLRVFETTLAAYLVELSPSVAESLESFLVEGSLDCTKLEVVAQASRLRCLSLWTPIDTLIQGEVLELASLPDLTLPQLEELSLRECYTRPGSIAAFVAHLTLPLVSDLQLRFSPESRAIFPDLGRFASHLTRLTIEHDMQDERADSGTRLWPFIATCPKLEMLHVSSFGAHDDLIDKLTITSFDDVFLPRLRELGFRLFSEEGFGVPAEDAVLRMLESRIGDLPVALRALERFSADGQWLADLDVAVNGTQRRASIKERLEWVETFG